MSELASALIPTALLSGSAPVDGEPDSLSELNSGFMPHGVVRMNGAPKSNAERQRQLRIRRRYEATGEAWLYTHCRECGTSIRPSFRRGFCPGGKCRKLFLRRVQVPRVCRLTLLDQNLSTAVLQ